MPKIVDYDQRRRAIAEQAIPIFARDGFHDANLSKIAGLCGFGRTTIYKYFKDKNDIFIFALDGIFGRLESEAEAIARDGSRNAIGKIEALFESMVSDTAEDRNRMLIVLDLLLRIRRDESSLASSATERLGELKTYYERVLADGMGSGELRDGDPAALASVLFSLVESFVLQLSFSDAFSYQKAQRATRHLLEGLKA